MEGAYKCDSHLRLGLWTGVDQQLWLGVRVLDQLQPEGMEMPKLGLFMSLGLFYHSFSPHSALI